MNITRQSLLLGMSIILAAQFSTAFAQSAAPLVAFVQASNVACKVGRPNVKPGETVTWQGQCADGLAQGAGVAQWFTDGKASLRFEGTFVRGLLEGKGKMIGADGDRYEGDYKGGLRHGHGVYVTGSGTRFEGEYVNNQRGTASAAAAVPPTPPAPPAQVAQAPALTSPPPVAPDSVTPRMRQYLDQRYPGWTLPKINREACSQAAIRSIVQGDFDGDHKPDYAIQFVFNRRYFLLALLDNGRAYILESNVIPAEEYPQGVSTVLLLKKKGSHHNDLVREYHFSQDTVQQVSCERGNTFFTYNDGKWKNVYSSSD